MKILLLEDDYLYKVSIKEFLQELDFIVDDFENGDEALDAIFSNSYDLLLLDIRVPGMDGFTLLETIRKEELNTPIIILTSLTDITNLSRGYDLGCNDYIRKPFDLIELKFRIEQLIKNSCFKTFDDFIQIAVDYEFDVKKNILYKEKEQIDLLMSIQNQKDSDIVIEKEIEYQLQTHKIKFSFFETKHYLESSLAPLYQKIVIKNIWIDEPFHDKFYEILILINRNKFLIKDRNSNVITMHVRGKDNKVTVSNAYNIFITLDIVVETFNLCIRNILEFEKEEAQNIVLVICILALEKSQYYNNKECPKNTIFYLLSNYEYLNDIKFILAQIKIKNERFEFIETAFNDSFDRTFTRIYNDTEISKPLFLIEELPEKILLHI